MAATMLRRQQECFVALSSRCHPLEFLRDCGSALSLCLSFSSHQSPIQDFQLTFYCYVDVKTVISSLMPSPPTVTFVLSKKSNQPVTFWIGKILPAALLTRCPVNALMC